MTAIVTVDGAPYVDIIDKTYGDHSVSDPATQEVEVKYENDTWTLVDGSIAPKVLTFYATCNPETNYAIDSFDKALITEKNAEGLPEEIAQSNFVIPTVTDDKVETVTIPPNGSVTLLYSMTVAGNDGANFTVKDDGASLVYPTDDSITVNDGTFSGTISGDEPVVFYVAKTFTAENIDDKGLLKNSATITTTTDGGVAPGEERDDETVPAEEGDETDIFAVTPADITIYMGGEQGYEAVVGTDGEILGKDNNSLPEPGFTVTLPEELEGTDVTELIFEEKGGTRTWTFAPYDGKDTTTVYKLVPEEGQEATRVIFTDKEEGHTIVSDEFEVGLEVNTSFDMALYKGSGETAVGDIVTEIKGTTYAVDSDNIGELTVRGTTEDVQFADANANAESVADPELDVAEGTTFTINDSKVRANQDGVALLFDEVIDTESENRTGLLEDKADDVLKVDADEMSYDFKYLDLVDTHNGNTWVKASDDVTIYWPLPEGTDADTDFTLLHFEGLHRDMESDKIESAIAEGNVEKLKIEKVENGYVVIKTGDTGFSPFALVWETDNGGSDTPGGDTPGGDDPWYPPYNPGDDDKPSGLNTEDHFSYVVGYEDGMVKPQRSITRAEVATIFYRLLEDDVRDDYDTTRNNFSDVTSDSWYNQTVSTLASMGILKGYEDGTFRPNASITRAEFAAIATRFFDETGATYEPGTFTDVTGDEWFAGAIMDAVNLGLIGGYEDGTVRPNNNITRAEACAIVNRTLGRVPDADHLLPADEMTTWPDNPSSAWFYADMQEATNGHEYEWITEDGNKIEEWTDILDKDWNDR